MVLNYIMALAVTISGRVTCMMIRNTGPTHKHEDIVHQKLPIRISIGNGKCKQHQHLWADVRERYLLNGKLNRSHIHVEFRWFNCVYNWMLDFDAAAYPKQIQHQRQMSRWKNKPGETNRMGLSYSRKSFGYWIWCFFYFSLDGCALFALWAALHKDVGNNNNR